MRALLLIAASVVSGCSQGFGAPGAPPSPDALTLAWLPTVELPTKSIEPGFAYSTGMTLSCTEGGYLALHAYVDAQADASKVGLAIAKVAANGSETATGSPVPLTRAAADIAPYGQNAYIYAPIAMSELCVSRAAGDYHLRLVGPDGTAVALGRLMLTP